MDAGAGDHVTVFPARINCNLKGQTMEEIEARRRTDLLAIEPYLKDEFSRDVPPVLEALKKHKSTKEVYMLHKSEAKDRLAAVWEELASRDAAWFNNDARYVEAISRAFTLKHELLAEAVKATFAVDPSSRRPALFAAVDAEAVSVLERLLAVEGAAVDVADDANTTAAMYAAAGGKVKALAALAGAGADLCAAREDGATALALAVMARNNSAAIQFIWERTTPSGLAPLLADALGRVMVEDGLCRMGDPLLHRLASALATPAVLNARLRSGVPLRGLQGEIGALLRGVPDLPEAVKGCLLDVRAFLSRHAALFAASDLPDGKFWQLAAQEPGAVFGDVCAAAEAASPQPPPLLIEWRNKPQAPHRCRCTIAGRAAAQSVAYSRCGSRLVRAEGNDVIVCDAVTLFELRRFVGHVGGVKSVAFNPADADELASGSEDKTCKLWSMKTGSCTRTLSGHRCGSGCLFWCPMPWCLCHYDFGMQQQEFRTVIRITVLSTPSPRSVLRPVAGQGRGRN